MAIQKQSRAGSLRKALLSYSQPRLLSALLPQTKEGKLCSLFVIILTIAKCLHGFTAVSDPHVVFCHRANSVTWNPHKMMGVPLQCSALLVREEVRPKILAALALSDILLLTVLDVFFIHVS